MIASLKLTWPLKMDGWNTTFLLGKAFFRGYVSFREGILTGMETILSFLPSLLSFVPLFPSFGSFVCLFGSFLHHLYLVKSVT